jgi:hypothetical protein
MRFRAYLIQKRTTILDEKTCVHCGNIKNIWDMMCFIYTGITDNSIRTIDMEFLISKYGIRRLTFISPICKDCFDLQSTSIIKDQRKTPNKLCRCYHNILQRCYNPKNPDYKYYGNRGIFMCDEWRNDYMLFESWAMSNGYEAGLSIDRINNDKEYSPSNCRFISVAENSRDSARRTWTKTKGESYERANI